MSVTKYALFLAARNGYFIKRDGDNIVTYDIEKAKIYHFKKGAMEAATGLFDELPHLLTLEVNIKPIAMGDVITRKQRDEAREIIEQKGKERLIAKMEIEKKIALDNWNREQGECSS